MLHTLRIMTCSALGVLGLGLGGLAGAAGADTATSISTSASGRDRPVIVQVTGNTANGFDVTYAGGDTISPPTDSEARAECSEYDIQLARVRCRVEVRTWYRDLGDLKRSLAYAAAHPS